MLCVGTKYLKRAMCRTWYLGAVVEMKYIVRFSVLIISYVLLISFSNSSLAAEYFWKYAITSKALSSIVTVPDGYSRVKLPADSFGAWLRGLPIKNGRPAVLLYDGSKKFNQLVHHSVVDIDIGSRNLQQCADAVMRMRAEYLWSVDRKDEIKFNYTSGDEASWLSWENGFRPKVNGSKVLWVKSAKSNSTYKNFRKYLDVVFTYAGSASLSKELEKVNNPSKIVVGDVFIQGGHPGHAVIVLDVAEDKSGERIFLLAQSYMPAQNIHLLRNPKIWNGPWYSAADTGTLVTPEWIFSFNDLKRFPKK